MNIERKLSAIKAINDAKELTEKALVALDFPYAGDAKPSITMQDGSTRIAIPDTVKDQVFTLVRDAYQESKKELIGKAEALMK